MKASRLAVAFALIGFLAACTGSTGGRFVARWDSRGSGDGQFAHPCGIAVDKDGNVYVVDVANNTIQKFRPR